MSILVRIVSIVMFVASITGCVDPAPVVTTASLLGEMTDLAAMAEFPRPAYTCRQFSSYDRKSKSPDDADGWFANGDAGKFLRSEARNGWAEHVMMEADGPGAIVRIWSANPKGTLRIYIDRQDDPVIEAPMSQVLGGELPGIPPPIAGQRGRGWNSYFPIPYAEHCKVTSNAGGFYYHVNYRTYEPGTSVVSFAAADLDSATEQVLKAAVGLAPAPEQGPELVFADGPIRRAWSGPGAIVAIRVKVESADTAAALRHLLLTMEFDGEQTVECPLGDFFGSAPGVNPYRSLPMVVAEDGEMLSRWFMPFRKSARLAIRNVGGPAARVGLAVETADYRWTDRSMHFHVGWKTEFDAPTMPKRDWNYAAIEGRGVFAGAALAIANPVRQWWGEGDEKIYVDGEDFPSHFGTGTEDYYGYAWCSNETFEHAYHNQPRCDGPGNYGHTSVNRWHILDRIPFERRFRFDMELWHWHQKAKVTMSVATYWYARPGATSDHAAIGPGDLRLVEISPYLPERVAGAIEGESMRIIELAGTPAPQDIVGCSGDQHLWWREAAVGDKLVVGFQVAAAGRYRVMGRFVKAGDYGIIRLAVNDDAPGEPIDFYNNGIRVSAELDLGIHELSAGENRLTAEIVGTNEKAVKRYMFGLDYLRPGPPD